MINTLLLASSLVLTPFDDYLGTIPSIEVCAFRYGPSTVLAPGTRLSISPFAEHYGSGSVIKSGDGATCSDCAVPSIVMDKYGVTTTYCEVLK